MFPLQVKSWGFWEKGAGIPKLYNYKDNIGNYKEFHVGGGADRNMGVKSLPFLPSWDFGGLGVKNPHTGVLGNTNTANSFFKVLTSMHSSELPMTSCPKLHLVFI